MAIEVIDRHEMHRIGTRSGEGRVRPGSSPVGCSPGSSSAAICSAASSNDRTGTIPGVSAIGGFVGRDQETGHPGGGIGASVADAVLDRVGASSLDGDRWFVISERDFDVGKTIAVEPVPSHRRLRRHSGR